MNKWRDFHGVNTGYVLELYDRYQRDPSSVDAATREFFQGWTPPDLEELVRGVDGRTAVTAPPIDSVVGAIKYAQAIREYGHLTAQLDPLGSEPPGDPSLDLETYGITVDELRQLPASLIGGPLAEQAGNALEATEALRRVYSSTTGYDFDHLRVPEEREWLRDAAESGRFWPPETPIDSEALLERLIQVEVFEHFLHRIFPGKTRFSIEGLDMMAPILDEVIGAAAEVEIYTIIIGMAHRGRLNVLAHVLNKPYVQILAEFKDPLRGRNYILREDLGWTGDVKYHHGARRAVKGGAELDLAVILPPNPSHVEHVNPVVEGMARAVDTQVDRPGAPRFDHTVSLPVLIHGDAAFPGQGIVAEALNLSRLPGYRTGGTIHIIANNQLGYTTIPQAGRSTLYASDLAKGFKIPILHVNADDPEACIAAARMALAYRIRFQKDFLFDLIGYRRYGHNEGDEPSYTHPVMYKKIQKHPSVCKLWGDRLVEQGIVTEKWIEERVHARMEELQNTLESLEPEEDIAEMRPEAPPKGAARQIKTAVPATRLRELNAALLQLPDGFNLNPKLARAMRRRETALDALEEPTVDWSTAEHLAFASILADGIAIRLTGEDSERGTFSQRHVVLHDTESNEPYVPLQTLPQAQAAFEVYNSPLTENAALGFEYGYNVQEPGRLVLWEAQYGDFINAAQAIVDEFLVSARAKWGQTPSLVLLLPHGYEGQGPNHSSGRLERFLQAAAETNMRIANCTTAAQYFHLLRRQALLLETDPLPLVVMTPKSLLRHRLTASPLRQLSEGRWQPVLDDVDAQDRRDEVRHLILCSGKIYVDLVTSDYREGRPDIALVRVEQLYPFPRDALQSVLDNYANVKKVVWVQEEPKNMGAWEFMQPRLLRLLGDRCPLYHIARPRSSSPAEGWMAWHSENQKALVGRVFE